mgnify:CR=1 FL=1
MKKLSRIDEGSWLYGVIGGIAKFFEINPDFCRIVFVILTFVPYLSSALVIIYFILAILMPKEVVKEDVVDDEVNNADVDTDQAPKEEVNKEDKEK